MLKHTQVVCHLLWTWIGIQQGTWWDTAIQLCRAELSAMQLHCNVHHDCICLRWLCCLSYLAMMCLCRRLQCHLVMWRALCCFAGRADPNCALGHVLKVLFKNDDFMTKVCDYEYIPTYCPALQVYLCDVNGVKIVLHCIAHCTGDNQWC